MFDTMVNLLTGQGMAVTMELAEQINFPVTSTVQHGVTVQSTPHLSQSEIPYSVPKYACMSKKEKKWTNIIDSIS